MLFRKPVADQMVTETTKDRHRQLEDHWQPLVGLVRTTKDRQEFGGCSKSLLVITPSVTWVLDYVHFVLAT